MEIGLNSAQNRENNVNSYREILCLDKHPPIGVLSTRELRNRQVSVQNTECWSVHRVAPLHTDNVIRKDGEASLPSSYHCIGVWFWVVRIRF